MQFVVNMILLMNRKESDIVLKNKLLKIATDPRVNGYQRGLASMDFMVLSFLMKELKDLVLIYKQIL